MTRFLRYCSIGVINLLVCIAVMAAFAFIGTHYIVYTFLGYTCAFIVSFLLNARYTFNTMNEKKRRFMRFIVINPVNLLVVELIQIVLIEQVQFPKLFAIFLGMSYYTLTGFFLNQQFVFSNRLSR